MKLVSFHSVSRAHSYPTLVFMKVIFFWYETIVIVFIQRIFFDYLKFWNFILNVRFFLLISRQNVNFYSQIISNWCLGNLFCNSICNTFTAILLIVSAIAFEYFRNCSKFQLNFKLRMCLKKQFSTLPIAQNFQINFNSLLKVNMKLVEVIFRDVIRCCAIYFFHWFHWKFDLQKISWFNLFHSPISC